MHSPIGGSSAGRWVKCLSSIWFEAMMPNKPSEASVEGDLAHEWSAYVLLNGEEGAPEVPDEMVEDCKMYIKHVKSIAGNNDLHVEEPMQVNRISKLAYGTPDCWSTDPANLTINLWDLKYGRLAVDVINNWSLIFYGIGILEKMSGIKDENITINNYIVQPRAYHPDGEIRKWTVRGSDLRGPCNQLSNAAGQALSGEPKFLSGEHCYFCKGVGRCPATEKQINTEFDWKGGDEIKTLRQQVKLFSKRLEAKEEETKALITAGQHVPGWDIFNAPSRLYWNDDVKPEVMEVLIGSSVINKTLKTPTQCIKSGIPKNVIKQFSKRGSYQKLVPAETTQAFKAFGGK